MSTRNDPIQKHRFWDPKGISRAGFAMALCCVSIALCRAESPVDPSVQVEQENENLSAERSENLNTEIPLAFYQIAIESIVVEVNEKYSRQVGVQYSYARNEFQSDGVTREPAILRGVDVNAPNTPPSGIVPRMNIIPGGINFSNDTRTIGAGIEAGRMDVGVGEFGLRLQSLIEEGKAQVRSRPLAVTLNKELVKIETADKVPYQDVTFDDDGRSKVAIKFEPVGVILHVTPEITSLQDELIGLNLQKIEVSTVGRFVSVRGVQRPVFVKSQANTNVIVRNHDTLVIGGFKIEHNVTSGRGVPFLRRIPLVKYAFSNESKSLERRDVLFYITPHILPPGVQPTLPPKFKHQEPVGDILAIPPIDASLME